LVDGRKELAWIGRKEAACKVCARLLGETTLAVESSKIGAKSTGILRFKDPKIESLYELHLFSVHGMKK